MSARVLDIWWVFVVPHLFFVFHIISIIKMLFQSQFLSWGHCPDVTFCLPFVYFSPFQLSRSKSCPTLQQSFSAWYIYCHNASWLNLWITLDGILCLLCLRAVFPHCFCYHPLLTHYFDFHNTCNRHKLGLSLKKCVFFTNRVRWLWKAVINALSDEQQMS